MSSKVQASSRAGAKETAVSGNGRAGRQELQGLQEAGRQELKREMIELRAKGWSVRKIASRLKLGKTTVANWLAGLEAEIAAARAIELDALYETARVGHEHRIKLLTDQLKLIQQELKGRGLADVPTERLLRLQLDYLEAVQEAYTEPRLLSEAEAQALDE